MGYRHDQNSNKGECEAEFRIKIPSLGSYEVRFYFPAHSNRASNTPVRIIHAKGEKEILVDQKKKHKHGFILGSFAFKKEARVIVSNRDTDGFVVIDAVQVIKK